MPGAPNSDSASAQAWYATCSRRFSARAGAQTGQIGPVLRFRYPHAPPAASACGAVAVDGGVDHVLHARVRVHLQHLCVRRDGPPSLGIDSNHAAKVAQAFADRRSPVRRCTLMAVNDACAGSSERFLVSKLRELQLHTRSRPSWLHSAVAKQLSMASRVA